MSDFERVDCGYQDVTCVECGRTYKCTPADDYYSSTTLTDGCCFGCLLYRNREKFKVNATTAAENARIADMQHNLHVEWVTPTRDWRGTDDLY